MSKTNDIVYYTLTKSFFIRNEFKKLDHFLKSNTFFRFQDNPHSSISNWIMLTKFFADDVLTQDSIFDLSKAITETIDKLQQENFDLSDFNEFYNVSDFSTESFKHIIMSLMTDLSFRSELVSNYNDYKKILNDFQLTDLLHLIWAPVTYFQEGIKNLNELEKIIIFTEVGLPKEKNHVNGNVKEMKIMIRKARSKILECRENAEKLLRLFEQLKQNHSVEI